MSIEGGVHWFGFILILIISWTIYLTLKWWNNEVMLGDTYFHIIGNTVIIFLGLMIIFNIYLEYRWLG